MVIKWLIYYTMVYLVIIVKFMTLTRYTCGIPVVGHVKFVTCGFSAVFVVKNVVNRGKFCGKIAVYRGKNCGLPRYTTVFKKCGFCGKGQ